MRRRFFRIIVILCFLLLILAASIQVILWTDLPRQWVLTALQEQCGMIVSADKLKTGWTGHTLINNATVRLPLEESPLMDADVIRLSHSTLLAMLLRRSIAIDAVQIDSPDLNVRQDEYGSWNIQGAVDLLGIGESAPVKESPLVKLPRLEIRSGRIRIENREGHIARLGPFNFNSESPQSLLWQFQLSLLPHVKISGQLAPHRVITQKINFEINQLPESLATLLPLSVRKMVASGLWQGQVKQQELSGRLSLHKFQLGETRIHGDLMVSSQSDQWRLDPDNLWIHAPQLPVQGINVVSGIMQLRGERVQMEQVVFESHNHILRGNGQWNRTAEKGEFYGTWIGDSPDYRTGHRGDWQAAVSSPQKGQKQFELTIDMSAKSPWGNGSLQAEIQGSGATWSHSNWQANVPAIEWKYKDQSLKLEKLLLECSADWPEIQFNHLHFAGADSLKSTGEYLADSGKWFVNLAGEKLDVLQGKTSPVDVTLAAKGDLRNITISEFTLLHPQTRITGSGVMDLTSFRLENVQTSIHRFFHIGETEKENEEAVPRDWQVDANIHGDLRPLTIDWDARLTGKQVKIGKQLYADLDIPFQGRIEKQLVTFKSTVFDLLDGQWEILGKYDTIRRRSQIDCRVKNFPVQKAVQLAGSPLTWQGTLSAQLQVDLPHDQPDRMKAAGNWRADNLTLGPLNAQSGEGQISIRNGTVRFDQIRLVQNQGTTKGEMSFSLARPKNIIFVMTAENWPLTLDQDRLRLLIDGKAQLNMDVVNYTAKGDLNATTRIQVGEAELGVIEIRSLISQRAIELEMVKGEIAGGVIEGMGTLFLDDWPASYGELDWYDLDLSYLGDYWPSLCDVTGLTCGSFQAAPSGANRPFEPMHLTLTGRCQDTTIRGAQLAGLDITAHLGSRRLLIEKADLDVMAGRIHLSGGIVSHYDEIHFNLFTDLEQLDLNQLVHLFVPQAKSVPGNVSGRLALVTTRDLRRLSAQADLFLDHSDLASNGIINTLYNAVNLSLDQSQPTGVGHIKLRAESSKLHVPSFYYFNRGMEVRGAGAIDDLRLGKNSPVSGYALATTSPLKGVTLPGINELNEMMNAIQKQVATIQIHGTLAEPQPELVAFPKVSAALQRLLWKQLRE